MSAFLYFLPSSKRAATPDDLRAACCGYSLRDRESVSSRFVQSGPNGQPGLVCAHEGDGLDPAFNPAAQVWRQGNGGRFFVGRSADQPLPGPADLVREKIYPGSEVRLLDGNDWTIPRLWGVLEGRGPTLPRMLDLADDGESIITRVHSRFAGLTESAFAWFQEWSGQKAGLITGVQQIQLAIDALAVNYRVGKVEALAMLGLWSTDEFSLILRAIIDADAIEKHLATDTVATDRPSAQT